MSTKKSLAPLSKLAVAVSAAALSLSATAADITWENKTGDWTQDELWNGGVAPGSEDVASFKSGEMTITNAVQFGAEFHIGKGGSGVLTIEPTGAVTGGCYHVGRDGGNGTLIVDGGSVMATGTEWYGSFNLGWGEGSVGFVFLNSGSIESPSVAIGRSAGATGKLVVSGGELRFTKGLSIGGNMASWDSNVGSGSLIVGCEGVVIDDTSNDDYMRFGGPDSILRLNVGGKLYFRSILRDHDANGIVEFNGGEMIKTVEKGAYSLATGSTAIDENHTIKILAGGMIFNSDYLSTFKGSILCPEGCGGITKRGAGELNLNTSGDRSFEFSGPIYVEGGTLRFSGNAQIPSFIDVIRVAEGATLVIPHDVTCRVLENNGTIHGGTVTVEDDAATKVVTRAVWTGAMEDGNVYNPKNYIVYDQNGRVMYEQTITVDIPVVVPYRAGAQIPSFNAFADVTWAIEEDTCSEGYSRPEVVKTAAAWYDPSDADTLTVADGKVTAIANKGLIAEDVGHGVDLDLKQRDANKSASSLSTNGFNGRQSIYFDGTSGFVSEGNFPADFPANGGRTMFVVAQGDVSSMIMFMISQGRQDKEEGRSMLLAHKNDSHIYGTGYKYGHSTDGGANWSADKVTFDAVQSNAPYVFAGLTAISSGDERTVTSFAMGKDGKSIGSTKNVSMPAGEQGARFNTYYGSFELSAYNIYKDTNGYQGEALIFTNALSDVEMEKVNAYLKKKWLDPLAVMPDFDSLVVNAQVNLGGATRTFEKLSGSGSFVDGTVVLTGELEVTVNSDGTVVAPTFDKLVLGPSARLVVKGARNLPTRGTINILPFTSLEGEFASVLGDRNTKVILRYLEDHVCARRDSGMSVSLR